MRRFGLIGIIFFLFFSLSFAGGISNEYGKFYAAMKEDDYIVTFVLDPVNKKFGKIQKVAMIDFGNDGEGDSVVLLYRNGNQEVFFRSEDAHKRHVLRDISADVCEGDWPPKIVYRTSRHAWACSGLNFFVRFFLWREIDKGIIEAKSGDWGALSERILENIKKIAK